MIFNERFQYTRRGSINRRNEFERAEFWSNELIVYERNTNFDRTLRPFFSGVAVHQRRWLLTPPAHCVCRRSCRCCAILRALEDACTLLAALLTSLRVAMTRTRGNATLTASILLGRSNIQLRGTDRELCSTAN